MQHSKARTQSHISQGNSGSLLKEMINGDEAISIDLLYLDFQWGFDKFSHERVLKKLNCMELQGRSFPGSMTY